MRKVENKEKNFIIPAASVLKTHTQTDAKNYKKCLDVSKCGKTREAEAARFLSPFLNERRSASFPTQTPTGSILAQNSPNQTKRMS